MSAAGFSDSLRDFVGGSQAIRYAHRELLNVDEVLKRVTTRRVAVQAGGGLGVFPLYLSAYFETVYTFEPDPEQFMLMTANAPRSNIVRFQAALGDNPGMVRTIRERRDGKTTPAHEGCTRVVPGGRIPTMRIDDLHLPACDLIYLDVEGRELWALAGAYITIENHRPVIACEINHHCEAEGTTRDAVREMILHHGYTFEQRFGNDELFVPTPIDAGKTFEDCRPRFVNAADFTGAPTIPEPKT